MGVIPVKKLDALAWFESHETAWFNNASNIGLTAAQATAFQTQVNELRTKVDQGQLARDNAKSATLAENNALAETRELASTMLSIIRAYAATQADPNVYVLANIPPPATPTPAPAPTPPASLYATINNDGNGVITWKAKKINGDFYTLERWDSASDEWSTVAIQNAKKYIDTTVPSGVASVQYRVRSHRGTQVSESSEPAVIIFGTQSQAA